MFLYFYATDGTWNLGERPTARDVFAYVSDDEKLPEDIDAVWFGKLLMPMPLQPCCGKCRRSVAYPFSVYEPKTESFAKDGSLHVSFYP